MDLGYFEKGKTVTVKIEFNHYRIYLWDTKDYFVQVNEEALESAINVLKADGLNITEHSDTSIVGTINSSDDGVLFTTIPYDSNWQVYVDGNRVSTYETLDAMLSFDISKGQHSIEMEYVHTPFLIGAIISILGIDLFILLWILDKKFGIKIIPVRKFVPVVAENTEFEENEALENSYVEAELIENEPQNLDNKTDVSEENNDIPS